MRFTEHYNQPELNIPIHFELCYFDESGKLHIGIPDKYFPTLIKEGALKEITLTEEKDDKYKSPSITYKDPDTGEERHFEVGKGNIKIGGDTILMNMSTATDCMSAKIGLCKLAADGNCYALAPEKRWGDKPGSPLAKNIRHEKQWACLTPAGIAKGLDEIAKALKKIKYVRVNEAGEFRNIPTDPALLAKVPDEMKAKIGTADDVKKLAQVGAELNNIGSPLQIYTYTHRTDLDVGDLGPNVCVNGSQYMLDNAFIAVEYDEFIDIMKKIKDKTIKGQEYYGSPVTIARHCIGDCRKCNYCKKKEKKHIFLPIHGAGTKYDNRVEKIISSVVNNPEFVNIVNSDQTVPEKAESLYKIVYQDKELGQELMHLVPIRKDRIDLFVKLVSGKLDVANFIKDLETYGKEYQAGGEAEASKLGIARSIDSLTGKFEKNMEAAVAAVTAGKGKQSGIDKWSKLKATLEKAKEAAEKGEKIKTSKALAHRWAMAKKG